ncbi:MAG: hypothetical protein Q9163_004777 [Psora crenata]
MPSYSVPSQTMPSHPMPPQVVPIPQPNGSGTINLYNIKPVNSGSLNLANSAGTRHETHPISSRFTYHPRRSRSRSPLRSSPDQFRDQLNPYRDERRKESQFMHIYEESRGDLTSPGSQYSLPGGKRVSGAHDRSDSQKSTETVMMDSNVVGLIIGRQGENMRRIEAETQTRIQFEKASENTGAKRRCTITGTKPARDHAVAMINHTIKESEKTGKIGSERAPPPPGRDLSVGPSMNGEHPAPSHLGNEIVIMVPSKTVGLIIGKGGETIKELQDRSHCHINVMSEEQTVNGLRPVHLHGTPEQGAVAKDLIMEVVETEAKKQTDHGVPSGSNINATALGVRSTNEKITDGIRVPSEAVGMIIGKGV